MNELVVVGDAGNTEANDGSRRCGLEATLFWRPGEWITIIADYAYTDARFVDIGAGVDYVPGAVPEVISGGITLSPTPRLDLTAKLRHFGSAPLIEDNSVRSDPTTLINIGGNYEFGKLRVGAELFNLIDTNQTQPSFTYRSFRAKPRPWPTGTFIRSNIVSEHGSHVAGQLRNGS